MFTGGGAARSLAKFKMQHSVQRGVARLDLL